LIESNPDNVIASYTILFLYESMLHILATTTVLLAALKQTIHQFIFLLQVCFA